MVYILAQILYRALHGVCVIIKAMLIDRCLQSLALVAAILLSDHVVSPEDQVCSWTDLSCYQDPHLKEIEVNLDRHSSLNETFLAYIPPDVSTFYGEEPFSRKAVRPSFNGHFGKFVNLSPHHVRVFW